MARRRTRRARSGRTHGLSATLRAAWDAFPPWWLRPFWKPRVNLLVLAFLFPAGVGVVWGSWQNLCTACPSVAQIRTWEPEETSKLYSHNGVLIGQLGIERRTAVPLAALPPHVSQAVIAIEDKRFYRHSGLDPRGVARAVFGVVTFNRRGGGSTITQQLARIMFREDVIDLEQRLLSGGLLRKLRELQVALELERSYTKEQILEAYLNQIYLGRAYGVQAGARAFLGKDAVAMNPAESALIAAILNVPGRYDPFRRPENALQRRDLVLAQMADQGYLTEQEAERWRAEPLPAESQLAGGPQDIAPYFQEWVRQILDSMYGQEVYRGGLKVTTTLDVAMQQAAEEAMEFGWRRIEALPTFEHPKYADFDTVRTFPGETPYLQGALVALDPYTGAVRALIGGRNYGQSKFDRARQARRQAGSSFKPFVYTAAIQSGIPASHIIVDAPVVYPQVSGTEWRPQNYEGRFEGPMTIREGLRRSVNMVAIKLGWEEVGIETVAQTARRMGITTQIERFPSTTIGAVEVIPLEVAEAYSAYATLGARVRPFPIVRVESAESELPVGAAAGAHPGAGQPGRTAHGGPAPGRGESRHRRGDAHSRTERRQPPVGGAHGRQDWDDQRRHRRLVHGLYLESHRQHLVRAGPPPDDHPSCDGGRLRGADLGPVHDQGLLRRQHSGTRAPRTARWPGQHGTLRTGFDPGAGARFGLVHRARLRRHPSRGVASAARSVAGPPRPDHSPGGPPDGQAVERVVSGRGVHRVLHPRNRADRDMRRLGPRPIPPPPHRQRDAPPGPFGPAAVTEGAQEGLLFTFETTHLALWAEDTAHERGIPVDVVPAPPEARAKCGIALRTLPGRNDELASALREEGITFGMFLPAG